jgi:hypothetical protein
VWSGSGSAEVISGVISIPLIDRDGKLDAKEWGVYRAMMSAETVSPSVSAAGRYDRQSIRWKYPHDAAGAFNAALRAFCI